MALFMTVENQKQVASELLSKLKMVDPFAMIAGGAPRDWYFNTVAKDLDVYLRLPNHNTIGLVTSLAAMVGIKDFYPINKIKESTYAELPNLESVFEGSYNGVQVNLMVMGKGVHEEIIKDFDVAICRAWFDGIECHYNEEFQFCVKTRVCLVHENYTGKEAHLRKMAKRFPQFMFYKKVEIPDDSDISFDEPPAAPPAPMKQKQEPHMKLPEYIPLNQPHWTDEI